MTTQHTDISPDPAREKAITDFAAWLLSTVAYRHPHWPHQVLAELRALAHSPLRVGYILEDLPFWLVDHLGLQTVEPGQDTVPDLLAAVDAAFDVDGARMTLTTAELLVKLRAVYPDTYRTWDTRLLDDTFRERGVTRCPLPGRDRVGYWHEDITRARAGGAAMNRRMTEQETRSEYTERTARFWTREAFRLAERAGWSVYGTHVDQPGALEFDGSDECDMPLWERPARPRRTDTVDDTALVDDTAFYQAILDRVGFRDGAEVTAGGSADNDLAHERAQVVLAFLHHVACHFRPEALLPKPAGSGS